MTDTALRAVAQSANNTHMVFANEEYEKFYYEKLEQARHQDCYHKALIYILGISEDTKNHFSQIYDMKSGRIKTECLHQGCQTNGSAKVGSAGVQADTGQVQEIPLSELHDFKGHPFKVLDDEKMQETVESIKNYGVLMPGIVRTRTEGDKGCA